MVNQKYANTGKNLHQNFEAEFSFSNAGNNNELQL